MLIAGGTGTGLQARLAHGAGHGLDQSHDGGCNCGGGDDCPWVCGSIRVTRLAARRHDGAFDKEPKDYLFTSKAIAHE